MDWISTFVADTEDLLVPESFRLWTGIVTVAGVLERRVWTNTRIDDLYPNQFAVLCGYPATGKSLAINRARKHWIDTPEIHIGPDNPTRKSFLDALENSPRSYINGAGPMLYSAMSVPSSELGVLFSYGDKDFFSTMTKLYDNEDQFTAPRAVAKSVTIERPTVNIIGGATPDFLGETFPDIAWGQGFTSRLIFIYGAEVHDPNLDIFEKRKSNRYDELQQKLNEIAALCGEFIWEKSAMDAANDWFRKKLIPIPDHVRLTHYRGRRRTHTLKLCMISAISRTQKLTVCLEDFERAKKWLLDAEALMPDVFRAMKTRSDEQLRHEAHQFAYSRWSSIVREKRQPLPESMLWEFIGERTTSDRISGVIESLYRSEMIKPGLQPKTFIPQPRNQSS